jgi:hypothetical protein
VVIRGVRGVIPMARMSFYSVVRIR